MRALLVLFGLLWSCGGDGPRSEPLRVGVVTTENQADTVTRHEPLAAYLQRKLGQPVELREATDYAGVIEAMHRKQLELAYFGPASYAKAWTVTGGNVEPLVTPANPDGSVGYHSVIVVRADGPLQSLDDLENRSFAYVDPNSTSGYQAVQYYLTKEGKPPAEFFSRTGFTGTHENSILAVLNREYDAASTWWNSEDQSSFARMARKAMIDLAELRVIWKSPRLPEDPWTVRKDLPAELRQRIKEALLHLQNDDPRAWRTLTDGQYSGFVEVDHGRYEEILDMLESNLAQRRERGAGRP